MEPLLQFVEQHKLFAVVRASSAEVAEQVARSLIAGGVRLIELTLTVPDALDALEHLSGRDGAVFGAGAVVDVGMAMDAINAGARFVSSPNVDEGVIELCKSSEVLMLSGAATPSEMMRAWRLGADLVRVFPVAALGGPALLKAVLSSMPFFKLVAAGGVDLESVLDYFRAGAIAVAVGSNLIDRNAIARGEYKIITERARQFVERLRRVGEN